MKVELKVFQISRGFCQRLHQKLCQRLGQVPRIRERRHLACREIAVLGTNSEQAGSLRSWVAGSLRSRVAPWLRSQVLHAEHGLTIPLFALFSFVSMAIIAMVVDHSRESLSLTTLQRAADAAALAGAKQLDGTQEGWQEAKKSAILALKRNPIHGLPATELSALTLDQGSARYDTVNTDHKGSTGVVGHLSVTVERGVVWYDYRYSASATPFSAKNKEGGYRFISFDRPAKDLNKERLPVDVRGYVFANAVRVTLQLNELATTFGAVLGQDKFEDLERSAIAITHEELEVPVAPIAIPLCSLTLNTDPYAKEKERAGKKVNLQAQCTRQGLATESDPKREFTEKLGTENKLETLDEIARRRQGLTRWESHVRPVYYRYEAGKGLSQCFGDAYGGYAANCTNLPLFATLGVPSARPGNAADATEVAAAFSNAPTATPGMYFAPLRNLREFANNAALHREIASALSDAQSHGAHNQSLTFSDAFARGTGNRGQFAAKRNFPFIRTLRPSCGASGPTDDQFDPELRPCLEDNLATPNTNEADPFYDLRLTWPMTGTNGETYVGRELVDKQYGQVTRLPLDYTNPTCHASELPIDALNSPSPERHRVRRMLAPVIAPSTDKRPDGRPVSYCDFAEVFAADETKGRRTTVAPVPESEPVIVGFVPIYVYDFNLLDLDLNPNFKPQANSSPYSLPDLLGLLEVPLDFIAQSAGGFGVPFNQWAQVSTPFYTDPVTRKTIVDRSPGELDLAGTDATIAARNKLKKYQEDHDAWEKCVEETESECEEQKPVMEDGGALLGLPLSLLRCFDFSPILNHPEYGNVLAGVQNSSTEVCTEPTKTPGEAARSYPCLGNSKERNSQMFKILDQFFNENVPALPHTHCLPQENLYDNNRTTNRNDPAFYTPFLDTVRLGFGCGGVQFKTACAANEVQDATDQEFFLPAGIAAGDTSPALIAEDFTQEDAAH